MRDNPPLISSGYQDNPPKNVRSQLTEGRHKEREKKRKNKPYEIKKRKIAIFLAATWICFLILAVGGLRGLEMTGRGSDKET